MDYETEMGERMKMPMSVIMQLQRIERRLSGLELPTGGCVVRVSFDRGIGGDRRSGGDRRRKEEDLTVFPGLVQGLSWGRRSGKDRRK
jgi:hypothetical protein